MPVKTLKDFLDNNHVKYVSIKHSQAYTAQEIAASSHISGKKLAKTVIYKSNGKLFMVVLPANHQVNIDALAAETQFKDIELAAESEFKAKFVDCDMGAMPPFGNLYDMDVFVAKELAQQTEIAFNAGNHTELIQLSYKDYENLVKPKQVDITE